MDPQTLWMNPADAADRNLKDGDLAEVFNDRGRIRMPVRVTDRIMPGVTAISQGAWYRPDKNGTDTAGSINVLTSLHPTPYARGNGQHFPGKHQLRSRKTGSQQNDSVWFFSRIRTWFRYGSRTSGLSG